MGTAATPPAGEMATTTVTPSADGWRLRIPVAVPAGPTRWRFVLPLLQSVTDQVVDAAVAEAESEGKRVSCRKGCGACCRRAVPVAPVEADPLRSLIDHMLQPRRAAVVARFADARRRLAGAGLLDPLERPDRVQPAEWRAVGLRYLALGIACPFLEDESCSIHAGRPLACRESRGAVGPHGRPRPPADEAVDRAEARRPTGRPRFPVDAVDPRLRTGGGAPRRRPPRRARTGARAGTGPGILRPHAPGRARRRPTGGACRLRPDRGTWCGNG